MVVLTTLVYHQYIDIYWNSTTGRTKAVLHSSLLYCLSNILYSTVFSYGVFVSCDKRMYESVYTCVRACVQY